MLTEEKIKSFAEKYSDRSGEFVISTLNHVMDYEAERGYELFDFTKDDFVRMFAKYNWVNSSRSFRNVKSIITGYIKSDDRASMYDLAEFSESDVSSCTRTSILHQLMSLLISWTSMKNHIRFV